MADNSSLRGQFGSHEKSSAQEGDDSGDLGGAFGSRSEGEDRPQQPATDAAQPAARPAARPAAEPPLRTQAPAEDDGPKKRYYTPSEVMAKKGCIGCGGMALALPLLLTVAGLVAWLR